MDKRKYMGRIFPAVLLLLGCLLLPSCGEKTQETTGPTATELCGIFLDNAENLPDMLTVTKESEEGEDTFTYLSDMDYSLVTDYVLCYAAAGSADEFAVVETTEENLALAVASLEAHLESRLKLYKNYAPEEEIRAEKAEIFTLGNKALLVMCDNASEVRKALENT